MLDVEPREPAQRVERWLDGATPSRNAPLGLAADPSKSNSPCSRSLAAANGGGRAGRPRHSRVAFTADGVVTVAMILRRDCQRGHSSTSILNTRSISSGQVRRALREAVGAARVDSGADAA